MAGVAPRPPSPRVPAYTLLRAASARARVAAPPLVPLLQPLRLPRVKVAAAGTGHGVHPTAAPAEVVVEVVAPDAAPRGETLEEGAPGPVDGEVAQAVATAAGPVVGRPRQRAPRHVRRLVVDGAAVYAGLAAHEVAEVGRRAAKDLAAAGLLRDAARRVATAAVLVLELSVPRFGPGQCAPACAAYAPVAEAVAVGVPPDAGRREDAPVAGAVGEAPQAGRRLLPPRSAGGVPAHVLPPGPDVPTAAVGHIEDRAAHDLLLGVPVDLTPVGQAVDA